MTLAQTDFRGLDRWRPGLVPTALRPRARAMLRRLWTAAIAFPDRGRAATRQDLPPEYFRFPCF